MNQRKPIWTKVHHFYGANLALIKPKIRLNLTLVIFPKLSNGARWVSQKKVLVPDFRWEKNFDERHELKCSVHGSEVESAWLNAPNLADIERLNKVFQSEWKKSAYSTKLMFHTWWMKEVGALLSSAHKTNYSTRDIWTRITEWHKENDHFKNDNKK